MCFQHYNAIGDSFDRKFFCGRSASCAAGVASIDKPCAAGVMTGGAAKDDSGLEAAAGVTLAAVDATGGASADSGPASTDADMRDCTSQVTPAGNGAQDQTRTRVTSRSTTTGSTPLCNSKPITRSSANRSRVTAASHGTGRAPTAPHVIDPAALHEAVAVSDTPLGKVYTKLQASKNFGILNTNLNEQSSDLEKLVQSVKAEVLIVVKNQGEDVKEELKQLQKDLAESLMPDLLDNATQHVFRTIMPAMEALQAGMNELKEDIQK
eukprot:jgi/Undpi1/7591/HiC_scaffold_23.g10064.m1